MSDATESDDGAEPSDTAAQRQPDGVAAWLRGDYDPPITDGSGRSRIRRWFDEEEDWWTRKF